MHTERSASDTDGTQKQAQRRLQNHRTPYERKAASLGKMISKPQKPSSSLQRRLLEPTTLGSVGGEEVACCLHARASRTDHSNAGRQRSSVMAEGCGHVVSEDQRALPRQVAALARRSTAMEAATAQTLRRSGRRRLPLNIT